MHPEVRPPLWERALDHYFPYSHVFNPWRKIYPTQPALLRWLLLPIVRLGLLCGFRNINYALVNGPRGRLTLGPRCSTLNTVFNVVSGRIAVGPDTLFSNDCQVLTGVHRFHNGRRASLHNPPPFEEIQRSGRDITIGVGCFIGAGATIIGPCVIGDNVIVGAGAVVTSDVPSGCFVAGVPARIVLRHVVNDDPAGEQDIANPAGCDRPVA